MSTHLGRLTLTLTAAAALAAPANAQTLYGIDSLGGVGTPLMVELTGGSGGACGYPGGPFASAALPASAGGCIAPAPFAGAPALGGDIAVNRFLDTIWIATPSELAEYDRIGVQVSGFPSPLGSSVTGLGFDSTGGRLWVASATEYAEVLPSCGAGSISAGPYANPHGAAMTDIAYDPHTGRLWASFADGMIGAFMPGGGLMCAIDLMPLGLAMPLTGLDLDTRSPGASFPSKSLFVTDSANVAHVDLDASCSSGSVALAAPDFAFPSPVFAVSGGGLSGLAFAAHGVPYGLGSGPSIKMRGMAVPGTTPTLELGGAPVGTAALFVDFGAQCAPPLFKGLPLYVLPTILLGPVAHSGSLSVPAPLPSTAPIGVDLHVQWYSVDIASGAFLNTAGMVLTTVRP
jgi:hypothetical protein